ncbi:Cof-type HAD-IIB family hydrolase [Paenibacillus alkalitolerans]|uniref:Cof-type HAD-IIB family hydrolase n=1 Tax=Paenibacillus alkalitolerans TaxID=2799335 RepID=UPI0018F7A8B2|nr:Cof-type HAD-IIB family hydrolase [Paenibacillus alkalitolerans]
METKYKLIAIDIDDTLLTDDLQVTPGTREALSEAIRLGTVVTLATGRMFSSTKKVAGQLGLNVPIITYQGALVKNLLDGEVLYERSVPEDVALEVVAYAQQRGLHLQGYIDDRLYAAEENDKVKAYSKLVDVPYEIEANFHGVAKRGSTKLLIIDDPDKLDAMIPELKQKIGQRAHITKSKPNFLEILHPEATKGHALLHLAAHYGIDRSETIAVGDSWNDHEMIEAAGLGVAMANAVEPLKRVADHITLSNNEEGVRAVVERFILGK